MRGEERCESEGGGGEGVREKERIVESKGGR